jgi:hypothetical protein
MSPDFALCRVLGNELPPRDLPGSRLNVLRCLSLEPPLANTVKFWIINRVWDPALAAAYAQMLRVLPEPGQVHVIEFDYRRYAAVGGARLCYCPGINHARNEALRLAFEEYGASLAAVLDGDCGFTPGQWEAILAQIAEDRNAARLAYSARSVRVDPVVWTAALGRQSSPSGQQDEHQLIMHRRAWDQGLRFDETRPFGDDDKTELFHRLGHYAKGQGTRVISQDRCLDVGECCHINTGNRNIEGDVRRRGDARKRSLAQLHADIRRYHGEAT